MRDDDETALVRQSAAGSEAAFAALVDRHQRAVRTFLRRICHDREEAEDLAQETFLTAWSTLRRFKGNSALRTWLFAIAWRKARNARRGWFRGRARDHAWAERQELERTINAGQEEAISVRRAVASLPLEQRAALALCLGGEFSHTEAADVLGIPLGTVKSHVKRGRSKLKDMLGGDR